MSDQLITNVLPTLVGGLLALVGGLIANYYIMRKENSREKRKELRTILEDIYKTTARINYLYRKAAEDLPHLNEIILEIPEQLGIIGMQVTLFVPKLEPQYRPYNNGIGQIINLLQKLKVKEINVEQYIEEATKCVETQKNFRDAIVGIVSKEGYSHF